MATEVETNRRQRRAWSGQRRVDITPREILFKQACTSMDELDKYLKLEQAVRETSVKMGAPFVWRTIRQGREEACSYLTAVRDISNILPRIQDYKEETGQPVVNREGMKYLNKQDRYTRKINGTSLSDIEGMELPLSKDNITRIDRMMRSGLLVYQNKEAKVLNSQMALLATCSALDQWREGESKAPQILRPLRQRLMDYFDHYVNIMIDPSIDSYKYEFTMFRLNFRLQETYFGLQSYIPARLGITPSSTTKLLQEGILQDSLFIAFSFLLGKKLASGINEAYIDGSLPEKIEPYQFYDVREEKKVEDYLKKNWGGLSYREEEKNEIALKAQAILGNLSLYQPRLSADLLRKGQRTQAIAFPTLPGVGLTLTAQNRLTLMMAFNFDERARLLLEMDKAGRLYGCPVVLGLQSPGVINRFIRQIYPDIEAKTPVIVQSVPTVPKKQEIVEDTTSPRKKRKYQVGKLKRVKMVVVATLTDSPLQEMEEVAPKYNISGKKISECISDPDQIDRCQKKLDSFAEMGHSGKLKMMTRMKGPQGEPFFEVGCGGWRILLQQESGNNLTLIDVVSREDLNKNQIHRRNN